MKIKSVSIFAAAAGFCFGTFTALAHPNSGIVVDSQGQVYFADLSRGLLKIDGQGKVTSVSTEGGHWLALDTTGSFSRVDFEKSKHWPHWFKRRTPAGVRPALITDGGSPLVVGKDGNIYFIYDDERMIPGGLRIGRFPPKGKETLLNLQIELGRTGHWPVPSGNLPDGMAGVFPANKDRHLSSRISLVPVGGSPTGAGESPALPISKTPSSFRQTTVINNVKRETRTFADSGPQKVVINEGPNVAAIQKATSKTFSPTPIREAMRQTPVPQITTRNAAPDRKAEPSPAPASEAKPTPPGTRAIPPETRALPPETKPLPPDKGIVIPGPERAPIAPPRQPGIPSGPLDGKGKGREKN